MNEERLVDLLDNGKLDEAIRLASHIGQSSMMIDPYGSLDRKELREWRDKVLEAIARER